jgi:hydrogenase nickel incorporation protein HypB
MCETCGCGVPSVHTIAIHERLLASNESVAEHNRLHLAARKIFTINLMGAPGAGKTALLEGMIRGRSHSGRFVVIEGDQATDRDSARIRSAGASAYQIETGLGCHLEATQIHHALHQLEFAGGEILVLENVGNLVCPALFDLGEHLRVLVTAPTEGVEKPLKYPPIFRTADIVILNKCDLIPYLSFDSEEWTEYVRVVNPRATTIKLSAATGDGLAAWLSELERRRFGFLSNGASVP